MTQREMGDGEKRRRNRGMERNKRQFSTVNVEAVARRDTFERAVLGHGLLHGEG